MSDRQASRTLGTLVYRDPTKYRSMDYVATENCWMPAASWLELHNAALVNGRFIWQNIFGDWCEASAK